MSKKLEQWLDEFIENGADPADVSNWPTTAGGGASVPEYEGPYTIRENGTIEIEGKKATNDITVNVPVVPNNLNDDYIAYLYYGNVNTTDVGDYLVLMNTVPHLKTTSIDTQEYYPNVCYFKDSYGYFRRDYFSTENNFAFMYPQGDGLGWTHGKEYDPSQNKVWEKTSSDSGVLESIYDGNIVEDVTYRVWTNDSGVRHLVPDSIPTFNDSGIYYYDGEVLTWCMDIYSDNYYSLMYGDLQNVTSECVEVDGAGYYFVTQRIGEKVNLPFEMGASETVNFKNGTYVFTRIR